VARALEERHAQKVLKQRDLARDRALRERQLLRRAGEAAVACGGVKTGQGLQAREFATHGALRLID